jgi:pyroglutamyl-peptidase
MKLLITGYPPFDQFPLNSTHQLIESMKADFPEKLAGLRESIVFDIVDFDNTDSDSQQRTMLASYRRVMDTYQPDICLFCGQAAARTMLTLETIAINIFKGDIIDPSGPPAYWATLPEQKTLIANLRAANIPAKLSHHAGTHLCNHILYAALRDAEQNGTGVKAGFLHLPMTASQVIECNENRPFVPLSMTREALIIAIRLLAETARAA